MKIYFQGKETAKKPLLIPRAKKPQLLARFVGAEGFEPPTLCL